MTDSSDINPPLLVRGARILDPASGTDTVADVHVGDGRIIAIGEAPPGVEPAQTIDAAGLWLLPGVVDLAAHLREPGESHKATIESESRAAAAAGITAVCVPPDTRPVIDTPAVVDWIAHHARLSGCLRIHPLGALTRGLEGEQISEMAALKDAGCVGVSNARHAFRNPSILRHILEYAATFGLTVFLHPIDPELKGDGCVHEGPVGTRLGLAGIPAAAETAALARELILLEQTGVRGHFCRLSCAQSAEMIATAQRRGLPVTADVAAHQLFLTDTDVGDFDSLYHVEPPLRSQADRDGLREAVANGTISAICSDHQPHEPNAKINPFAMTTPGISALETLLPLGLRLVREGVLQPLDLAARLASGPAAILGLDSGRIAVDAPADLCLVDPEIHWRLDPEAMLSAGRNTPFGGWDFVGRAVCTILGGRVVSSRN